jgi:hypothetical protein
VVGPARPDVAQTNVVGAGGGSDERPAEPVWNAAGKAETMAGGTPQAERPALVNPTFRQYSGLVFQTSAVLT